MYKWIALISGFCLMAFELVAARLLAPTIGSSTFIWTNVIGVIMGALAVGYWLGGKLADRKKRDADIVGLCILAAALVVFVLVFNSSVIEFARSLFSDARWQGLFAALFLFAPTSVVIGMLSPYLAKLVLKSTAETGKTVAKLSTYNALGSIAGTFITGFFLLSIIGSRATLAIVASLLIFASWLIRPKALLLHRAAISLLLLITIFISLLPDKNTDISIDTATANYQITQGTVDDRPVSFLHAGPNGAQSAVYNTGEKDLVFWYTQEIADVVQGVFSETAPERILIIGGGAFTLPEYFGRLFPNATVDTVEIDPDLETIARDYFRFEKPSNVVIYSEDARSYVNRIQDKSYDAIIVDVFSDADIPWQFVTYEFGKKVSELLSEQGIVIANFISAQAPGCTDISEALIATFSHHLPIVYKKSRHSDDQAMANQEFVFSRKPLSALDNYESPDAASLTPYHDDYAPIEHLWQKCINSVN